MERYIFNECVYLGANARSVLPEEIKRRKFKRVLLVTDDVIISTGVLNKVSSLLDSAKIKYAIYSDIKPNPTVENVQNGLVALLKAKADVIVAVGGGSCSDGLYDAVCAGCDTFITSDVKYNGFWDAKEQGLSIIDAGHFHTENPVIPVVAAKIAEKFPEIQVKISETHADCMKFY